MKRAVITMLLIATALFGVDYSMDTYKISGIAHTNNFNRNGRAIDPQGFNPRGHQIPILLEHESKSSHILGHVTKIIKGSRKVYFEAELNFENHNNILNLVLNKYLAYVSIGYIPMTNAVSGMTLDADILEISLVPVPADPQARIISIERMGLWFLLRETALTSASYLQHTIRN